MGYTSKLDKASLSHSSTLSNGQIVSLDRFQVPMAKRYRGLGPRALRQIMQLYKAEGCQAVVVPAANNQGARCYQKCGFVKDGVVGNFVLDLTRPLPDLKVLPSKQKLKMNMRCAAHKKQKRDNEEEDQATASLMAAPADAGEANKKQKRDLESPALPGTKTAKTNAADQMCSVDGPANDAIGGCLLRQQVRLLVS